MVPAQEDRIHVRVPLFGGHLNVRLCLTLLWHFCTCHEHHSQSRGRAEQLEGMECGKGGKTSFRKGGARQQKQLLATLGMEAGRGEGGNRGTIRGEAIGRQWGFKKSQNRAGEKLRARGVPREVPLEEEEMDDDNGDHVQALFASALGAYEGNLLHGLALVDDGVERDLSLVGTLDLNLEALEGLLEGVLGAGVEHLGLDLGGVGGPDDEVSYRSNEDQKDRKLFKNYI